MKNPCIAIDISKGSSFYQGFTKLGNSISKAKRINHDLNGYDVLLKTGNSLKEEYGEVTYIFESTGIYHKSLQQYLEEHEQNYIILNPLEAAKIRKMNLRSTKTDKKDCESISKAYFLKDYKHHRKQEVFFETIQSMNRYYNFLIDQYVEIKKSFRNQLDIVYPKFDELHHTPYLEIPIAILKKYPHPDFLKNSKVKTIENYLVKTTPHRKRFSGLEANKLKEYSLKAQSGCDQSSIEVTILKELITSLDNKQQQIKKHLEIMKIMCVNKPLYQQLLSIPGIGENLAIRLIGELGNLSRFSNKRQLVAYAGIDPTVYQSGNITGEHLHITKKGNKHLRTLLFLAVSSNIRNRKSNSILDFYKRKRQQNKPLAYKTAVIACANKLLRIIYSMHESGELFHN